MRQPPGSENHPPDILDVSLSVIAILGLLVHPIHPIFARILALFSQSVSLVQQFFGRSELDPKALTREIGNSIQGARCSPEIIRWSIKRAAEVLIRYGSEPINRIGASAEGAQLNASWMAEYVLNFVKDKDLDPGNGKERQCTYRMLRAYYDVYLHHKDGLAQIESDVMEYVRKRLSELPTELYSIADELLRKAELRKAETGLVSFWARDYKDKVNNDELSLKSITAKKGVVSFVHTRHYDAIKRDVEKIRKPTILRLIGPGGSGKTRLAIELSRELEKDGWYCRFVKESSQNIDYKPIFEYYRTKPILIVVDYSHRMRPVIKNVTNAAAEAGWLQDKFVLVLLDRVLHDVSFININDASDPDGVGDSKITYDIIDKHIWHRKDPIGNEVAILSEEEAIAIFYRAIHDLQDRYMSDKDAMQEEQLKVLWGKVKGSATKPLNILLAALLAVKGALKTPMQEQELLGQALDLEVSRRWMGYLRSVGENALNAKKVKQQEDLLKALSVYVTLLGNVSGDQLKQYAQTHIDENREYYSKINIAHVDKFIDTICAMHGDSISDYRCTALEPDPVADYLITSMLKTKESIIQHAIVSIYDTNDSIVIEKMLETMWRALPIVGEEGNTKKDSRLGGIKYIADIIYEKNMQENVKASMAEIEDNYGCRCDDKSARPTLVCLLYLYIYKSYVARDKEVPKCIIKIGELLGEIANNRSSTYISDRANNAQSEYGNEWLE